MDSFDIIWRVGNVMFASIAIFLLVWTYTERWQRLALPDRMVGTAFVVLVTTSALASFEQLINHIEPGIRTGFTTVALAYLIWGLAAERTHAT